MDLSAVSHMLWKTACSAWRWTKLTPHASPSNPPPQYSSTTFGLLQASYLHGCPITLAQQRCSLTLTDSLPMFTAIGTRRQISDLLHTMPAVLFCKTPSHTSNLVIELFHTLPSLPLLKLMQNSRAGLLNKMVALAAFCWRRLVSRVFSYERQLIIRSENTIAVSDQTPYLSIKAPQGIMLSEIAGLLDSNHGGLVDLTRNKELNIRIMGRSRSLSWLDDCVDSGNDPLFLLPPYQPCQSDLPPAYSM
ncbi:hypothetical protein IWW36_001682 [Coemansia brasiliensis]|uniref:Uncharacterized protein n=1 Tax=Coemansia brasiliensis TaxID=2650707 RepID=A0A9W8M1B3_9FUNG|nr:hypothetical protein IWW36_001682 [Coemansia brasiliensis]